MSEKTFSRRVLTAALELIAARAQGEGRYARFIEVMVMVLARHLSMMEPKIAEAIVADVVIKANEFRAQAQAQQSYAETLMVDDVPAGLIANDQAAETMAALLAKVTK